MRFPSLLVATGAGVAALLAGCTTEVAGTPSAPTGLLLPPRPREVRLDGVDPCSLLTPDQRAGLGLTSQPSGSKPYVSLFMGDVPTCTMYSSSPGAVLLGVGTVTTVGIERWETADLAAPLQPVAVEGFPALIAVPTPSSTYCSVEIDIAAGQLLDVQIADAGDSPPVPQADLCRRATSAAKDMVQTLTSK